MIRESYDIDQKFYLHLQIYYGHYMLEGNKNLFVLLIRGLDGLLPYNFFHALD